MKNKNLRCAIYIRVSSTEQAIHGKSLEAQQEFLTAFEEIIRRSSEQEQVLREMTLRCLGKNA